MAKYRVLRGVHYEDGVRHHARHDKSESSSVDNDVFESERDLLRDGRDREKYERVSSVWPISNLVGETNDFNRMTVPALMKLAKDEDIDLGDATLKDEIIEAIRGACA